MIKILLLSNVNPSSSIIKSSINLSVVMLSEWNLSILSFVTQTPIETLLTRSIISSKFEIYITSKLLHKIRI